MSPGTVRVFARVTVRRVMYVLIGVLGALTRVGRRHPVGFEVRQILVCRLDLVGDLVFTRPLIRGMREQYPNASITLLTLPYTAPLAGQYEEVDAIITVDTNRIRTRAGLLDLATWTEYFSVAQRLRAKEFDLGVSVCGRMASLCVFLSGAKHSIGYDAEAYPFLLTSTIPGGRYNVRKHEVEYVRTLARAAGAVHAPTDLDLAVPRDAVANMHARLATCGVRPVDRLIVVHAGAVNGSAKRWPPAHWALFIDRIAQVSDARIVLTGAASDEPIANAVLDRTTAAVLSFVGTTSLLELCALIDRADLVASGDSGPCHLAVALGRPLVAAYGPTDPQVHGPYYPRGPVQIHRADLPCSPCYSMSATAECPLGDPICMRLVTVDQMFASALSLLDM